MIAKPDNDMKKNSNVSNDRQKRRKTFFEDLRKKEVKQPWCKK